MDHTLPILLCALWALFSSPGTGTAQCFDDAGLPLTLTAGPPPLTAWADPGLQASLERELAARPAWKALVDRRKLAVGLVDLSDPQHVRYASLNGAEMMYAASLPKIAVLLAAEEAMESGKLPARASSLSG